jgi:hypothetical protein
MAQDFIACHFNIFVSQVTVAAIRIQGESSVGPVDGLSNIEIKSIDFANV